MARFIYEFNSVSDILEIRIFGEISIENVLEYYQYLENNPEYPRELRILINARDSNFDFRTEELSKISDSARNAIKQYNAIREAIIVSQPVEPAMVSIFSLFDISNHQFQIFHTRIAALNWLQE